MKSAVGVLLAALVGIHCSAGEGEGASDSEISSQADTSRSGNDPKTPTQHSPETAIEPQAPAPAPTVPGWDTLVKAGVTPIITSTVVDPLSGFTYATGTFVGDVAIGNDVIKSHGDKDVFLLKLGTRGAFQWVRAVGSGLAETAPRVTLSDDGRVTVVGLTKGEMDCGSGPLQRWSSDTFFLCTFGGADGAPLSGGVFPTGSP